MFFCLLLHLGQVFHIPHPVFLLCLKFFLFILFFSQKLVTNFLFQWPILFISTMMPIHVNACLLLKILRSIFCCRLRPMMMLYLLALYFSKSRKFPSKLFLMVNWESCNFPRYISANVLKIPPWVAHVAFSCISLLIWLYIASWKMRETEVCCPNGCFLGYHCSSFLSLGEG